MFTFARSRGTILVLLVGFGAGCGGASSTTPSADMQGVVAQAQLTQSAYGQARELAYVSNEAANSITAYAMSASGNAHPVLTIAGSKTKLDQPVGLAFDASGKLYVVNHGLHESSITIYAGGATGNVAPIGTIEGAQTHLRAELAPPDYPTGAIAVDSTNGRLFVGRVSAEHAPLPNNVLVFNLSARGDAAPIRSIGRADNSPGTSGAISDMEPAPAVLLDGIGPVPKVIAGTELEACCHGSDGWTYYDASGLATNGSFAYYANEGLYGLAVSPGSGKIVASFGDAIDVWPAGVTGTAGGPGAGQLPLRVISGGPAGFGAVAVDSTQRIWALVRGTGSLLPPTTGAEQIDVYGPSAITPVVISGSATGLSGASGIAVLR